MAFAVEDFQDLLQLLDQHPEWQAELRRRLLPEELLGLPGLVHDLVEAQGRTEQRVEELAVVVRSLVDAQGRTELRLDALAEAQARTEQRVEELAVVVRGLVEAQARTEQRLDALTGQMTDLVSEMRGLGNRMGSLEHQMTQLVAQVSELVNRVGDHSGKLLEIDYARKGPAYFRPIARRLRVLDFSLLGNLLADAVDDGRLTPSEEDDVMGADVVLAGKRREDGADIYIVVEVSWGIGTEDIVRAARRARVLGKLGRSAVPVVAGRWIDSLLEPMVRSYGVWRLLNGSAQAPEG